MSLIESKYWKCKQCGEFSIRLLFAPLVSNMQEVISFADSNQHQYDSEYCEVWLIGSPMDQGSEDSLYLTAKIWPTLERPENIRPSEFDEHIAYMEENHCFLKDKDSTPLGIDDLRKFRKNYGF